MKTIIFSLFISVYLLSIPAHALRFTKACDPGDSIIIGAVGDVLLHTSLQVHGYKYGFESIWSPIAPFLSGPDIMYANLEGPSAPGVRGGKSVRDPGRVYDNGVYTGYPMFNYHPTIIEDLKQSGVDIVSTSNNHSLDRGDLGVLRTIDELVKRDLDFMGTRKNKSEDFYKITNTQGSRLAWIACTYGTNGIPDRNDLVLDCFETNRVSQLIQNLKTKVDAVIVTPHWGNEYQLKPNAQQKQFARKWLDEGATAVIGAHPHVPQTWEKYTTQDAREGLILYSLGNFISNQYSVAKQSSLILFLGLSKKNGSTWVNGVRYLPLFMNRRPPSLVASNFVKRASGAQLESLRLVKNMFGEERIVEPGEDVVTNAECE